MYDKIRGATMIKNKIHLTTLTKTKQSDNKKAEETNEKDVAYELKPRKYFKL